MLHRTYVFLICTFLTLCNRLPAEHPIDTASRMLRNEGYAVRVISWDWHESARYQPDSKTIELNRESPVWTDPKESMAAARKINFFSSDDEFHLLNHEIGHAKLHEKIGTQALVKLCASPLALPADYINKNVSSYATKNPVDFHAEVYAGIKAGHKYPDDIIKYYVKLSRAE